MTSVAPLAAEGRVELVVDRLGAPMRTLRSRPARAGVRPALSPDGRSARFVVTKPTQVSLEPDGETGRNLQVFVDPVDRSAPTRSRSGVIYFGPGVHELPGDHVLSVPSHTRVEIAAGAVVRGSLRVAGRRDVLISGRGIVDPGHYFDEEDSSKGVFIYRSSNVGVTGVTIVRGQNGAVSVLRSRDVAVENIKVLTTDEFSDGMNIGASEDVLVDRSYFRTSDDSIAIWATDPWFARGSTGSVTVRNTTLWPDVAHGVLIGPFGRRGGDETVSGVDFQSVDVLEQDVDNPRYQGAVAINPANDLTISDVRFQDLWIDPIAQGQAFNIRVFDQPDYDQAAGQAIRNVLLRDVHIAAGDDAPSVVSGYARDRPVQGVLVEGLVRAGVVVAGAAAGVDVQADAAVAIERRRTFARLDDRDRSLRYAGRWSSVRAAGAAAGAARRAARTGATMSFAFSGRQARILGMTGPRGGRFRLSVDGRSKRTVDTYSRVPAGRRILFDTGDLGPGRHRVVLRVAGAGNRLSLGTDVTIDSLEVVP